MLPFFEKKKCFLKFDLNPENLHISNFSDNVSLGQFIAELIFFLKSQEFQMSQMTTIMFPFFRGFFYENNRLIMFLT